MSTPIARNLRVDGTRVAQRTAAGFVRWSDHPSNIPRAQWHSDAYEAAVVAVSGRVLSNRVGRIVVDEFARQVTVIPFPNQAGGNAFGTPINERGSNPRGARQFYCGDLQNTPVDETGQPIPNVPRGTGAGTTSFVEFTPQHWTGANVPGADPNQIWADELLLHEMVHALANTRGAHSCRAAGFNYDTYDEFVAITVTNVYRSHFHRPQRNNHHWGAGGPGTFTARPAQLPPARQAAEDRMLRELASLMPTLVDRLANLDEPFASDNVFRDAARRGVVPRVTMHRGGPPRRSARLRPVR